MIQTSVNLSFLRCYLGNNENMSAVLVKLNWLKLYSFASKQTVLGLCFDGISRLGQEFPDELKKNPIARDLLMIWMGKAQQIRRQNMKVNAVAGKLFSMFREDGLRCCILKGQGNALIYPNPYSRTPGDIDVWVNASKEEITEYAKRHFTLEDDIRFHHLETTMDGVPVELHFFPCIMNNPIYNARLQKWFRRNVDLQCSHIVGLPDGAGDIAIPTTAFNVIYQLCHLYHHFFDEGIGMRQIIDYYYVVDDFWKVKESFSQPSRPSLPKEGSTAFPKPLSPQGTEDVTALRCSEPLRSKDGGASKPSPYFAGWDRLGYACELKHLGLWKFAGAVMYVLHEALGLSEEKMIAPMDEKRGKLLLAEILNGGNFGQHFTKYGHFTQQGMAKKYFLKIWRNMHFVRYYPAEALSEPIFRTWHFFWRMNNKK